MIFFRIIFFLISLWFSGFLFFCAKVEVETPVKLKDKFDAIIVLTGAKGRIDTGLKLLTQEYAEYLFISGVGKDTVLNDLTKFLSEFTPQQVEFLKHRIMLGHLAQSTQENAQETMQWLKNKGCKKILLVTSNYHMLRSMYLFKHLMPEIDITPYPVVIFPISIRVLFLEYHKFLFSLVK